jgi:formyl-CoA transferase
MLDFQAARWTIAKEVPGQAGNNHPTSIPTGVFATADGYINIAAAGDDIYKRLCKALDAPHLAADPLFATGRARSDNRDALNVAIEAITRTKPSAHWIEVMNKAGAPAGPIYTMDQVFADPQVKHLAMTRTVPHKVLGDVEVIGQPIELSRTPWSIRSATPEAGEHTDAVLTELGYSSAEIAALHAGKVV